MLFRSSISVWAAVPASPLRTTRAGRWQTLVAALAALSHPRKRRAQAEIMPRAMAALSHKLRLRMPVGGALRLPRACTRSWVGSGECVETRPFCATGAVPLVDPLPARFFGDYQCAPRPAPTPPPPSPARRAPHHKTHPYTCRLCSRPGTCRTLAGGAGVEGADFVVIVTSRASPACNAAVDAHAVHCVLDEGNWYGIPNRPLAGHINFCPRQRDVRGARELNSIVDTAVHELLHTLFMADSLFERFVTQTGAPAPCAPPHRRLAPCGCAWPGLPAVLAVRLCA